jgi:hypothetical protein
MIRRLLLQAAMIVQIGMLRAFFGVEERSRLPWRLARGVDASFWGRSKAGTRGGAGIRWQREFCLLECEGNPRGANLVALAA